MEEEELDEIEVDVCAFTETYSVVVTVLDEECCYGVLNNETGVIEHKEFIFSNVVDTMLNLQEGWDSVQELIGVDGRIDMDYYRVATPKEKLH